MSKEHKNSDQASELREQAKSRKAYPPRSKVHANKKKKTKWKIHYPIVRLFFITFLLIPIVILAVTANKKGDNIITKWIPVESSTAEQIQITKPSSQKEVVEEKQKDEENKLEEEKKIENTTSSNTNKEEQSTNSANDPKSQKKPKAEEKSVIDQKNIAENVEIIYHTVAAEETLYRISMKYYDGRHGEKIIRDFNGLINNQIKEGQVLQIPIKKQ